jgi:thiosulfate dehydrogenase (quinone) large subunit
MRLPGEIVQGVLARAALALLRVYLGLVLIFSAIPTLRRDFTGTFIATVERAGANSTDLWYRELLQDGVLQHAPLFAFLVSWGQLLLGVLFVLGLTTRLWGATMFVLAVGYTVTAGAWPGKPGSEVATLGAISLALIIGAAGRTFGLDSILASRWPRSMLW